MPEYRKNDTNPMGWEEMSETIDGLIKKVNAYFNSRGEKVSVISPLLRTGGIIGGIIAAKMRIVPMLPIQLKYSYQPTISNQIISLPEILVDLPQPMNVLLCEGNTNTGTAAIKAAQIIKTKYPQAQIYLATACKVFGGPDQLDGIEEIFYGRMTDEKFQANEKEKTDLDLRAGITIFPWENADDELREINAA